MIGKTIQIKGNITGSENLVVEGKVDGAIELPQNDLTIGESGQVVADATNAVRAPVPDGHDTMGDLVAALVPDAVAVVKAFNTIGAEHLGDGRFGEQRAFLPIAGDQEGVEAVLPLAEQLGFDAVALGGREAFGMAEDHARLWIHLAFVCGWGRGFGFAVVGDH